MKRNYLKELLEQGITELEPGRGSLENYSYFIAGGIKITNKEAVAEGIVLKIPMSRKDKITGKIEKFNYKTKKFEEEIR